jgi:MFS family permease
VPQLLPQEVLARANSFDWLLSLIAMPIGFAIWGPLSDHIGIPSTLLTASVLLVAPTFLIILLVPGVRHVKRTAEGRIVLEPAT